MRLFREPKEGEERYRPASPFIIKAINENGFKFKFYKATYLDKKWIREIVELNLDEATKILA